MHLFSCTYVRKSFFVIVSFKFGCENSNLIKSILKLVIFGAILFEIELKILVQVQNIAYIVITILLLYKKKF